MIDTARPTAPPRPRSSGGGRRRGTVPPAEPLAVAARRRRRAGRRRGALTDLLGILAWVSAAVAVLLWLVSPGSHTVVGIGGWLTDAGIVAGLVATDLVLVMLVLAARVPLIDRTFGQDNAIAVHRSLGKPVLYLLLAHGASPDARVRRLGGHRTDRRDDRALLHARHAPGLPGTRTVRRRGRLVPRRRPTSPALRGLARHPPAQLRGGARRAAAHAQRRQRPRPGHVAARLLDRAVRRGARTDRRIPVRPAGRRDVPPPHPRGRGRGHRAGGRVDPPRGP